MVLVDHYYHWNIRFLGSDFFGKMEGEKHFFCQLIRCEESVPKARLRRTEGSGGALGRNPMGWLICNHSTVCGGKRNPAE
jgi:hypothetical protein